MVLYRCPFRQVIFIKKKFSPWPCLDNEYETAVKTKSAFSKTKYTQKNRTNRKLIIKPTAKKTLGHALLPFCIVNQRTTDCRYCNHCILTIWFQTKNITSIAIIQTCQSELGNELVLNWTHPDLDLSRSRSWARQKLKCAYLSA